MKLHLAAAAAALAVSLIASSSALAAIEFAEAGNTVRLYDGAGGRGGVFYVDVIGKISTTPPFNGSSPNYDFPTFCVEIFETIALGASNTYNVSAISDTTVSSGYKLGSFAAWLYTKYLEPIVSAGTGLTGITGYGTTAADANAIQRGIWLSMGYTTAQADGAIDGGYDSTFFTNLHSAYTADLSWSSGVANVDNAWNYGLETGQVAIMNLTKANGANVQDQLVIDPELPPPGVPEPVGIVVWSLLAMTAASVGTRRR
jgi:hypothetical protein